MVIYNPDTRRVVTPDSPFSFVFSSTAVAAIDITLTKDGGLTSLRRRSPLLFNLNFFLLVLKERY